MVGASNAMFCGFLLSAAYYAPDACMWGNKKIVHFVLSSDWNKMVGHTRPFNSHLSPAGRDCWLLSRSVLCFASSFLEETAACCLRPCTYVARPSLEFLVQWPSRARVPSRNTWCFHLRSSYSLFASTKFQLEVRLCTDAFSIVIYCEWQRFTRVFEFRDKCDHDRRAPSLSRWLIEIYFAVYGIANNRPTWISIRGRARPSGNAATYCGPLFLAEAPFRSVFNTRI